MLIFQFPGQGSQSVGMGVALAEAFPAAKQVFAEIDDALVQATAAFLPRTKLQH